MFTMITKVFVLCLIAGLSSADDRILDWTQLLGAGLGAGAGAVPGAATGGVLGLLKQTVTRSKTNSQKSNQTVPCDIKYDEVNPNQDPICVL